MAIETRTLVFSPDELTDAAYKYCLRKGIEIPEARITGIEPLPEPNSAIILRFAAPAGSTPLLATLSYSQMAAALILHCRDQKIPLPRRSQKRLTPAGDGMALIVRVGENGPVIAEDERDAA